MTSLLLALLLSPAAAFQVPGFELVYTAPVETTLQEKGLREASKVWPEMIKKARRTVDLQMFYITPKAGEPLEPTLKALARAVKRGVRVRLLLERKMDKASAEGYRALDAIPGLEYRVIDFSKVGGGITHAKFFVVDGKSAYIGSQNLDWRSLKHIHELGLRTTEPGVVSGLQAVFEHDWAAQAKVEAGEPVPPLRQARPQAAAERRAYLVASPWRFNPDGIGDSEGELVRLIGAAEKELRIQLLDYAPLTFGKHLFYAPIDNALRLAATKGVKIKLLVSHWNTGSPQVQHLKSLALVPGIEVRVATLPQSKDGYIPFSRVVHSKYMTVDGGVLWLGTSNWAGGYLDDSRNAEVVVKDERLASRVSEVHAHLWESEYSEPLDIARIYPRPKR